MSFVTIFMGCYLSTLLKALLMRPEKPLLRSDHRRGTDEVVEKDQSSRTQGSPSLCRSNMSQSRLLQTTDLQQLREKTKQKDTKRCFMGVSWGYPKMVKLGWKWMMTGGTTKNGICHMEKATVTTLRNLCELLWRSCPCPYHIQGIGKSCLGTRTTVVFTRGRRRPAWNRHAMEQKTEWNRMD